MLLTLEGDTLTMDSPPLPARDNLRQRLEAPCVLKRIFLAVKDEHFSVRKLGPEQALASLYNDVVPPHTLLSADANAARIRKAHLCFALQRAVPVFELHFDRQGRFWEQLSTTQWPESMHEQTIDTSADGPKRFVSRAWLEQYRQSGAGRLTILSGSMAPLINTGDQIFIRKTPLDLIHIGDIITFWKGDVLVTHRVIRTCIREAERCFVECGDAVWQHALCCGQSVIGRVAAVKKGKREVDFETIRWKACNRLIGIGLLCACAARAYGRKLPGVPARLRACVRRACAAAARQGNKALRYLLS
jgi:signal peptidase I